MAAINLTDLTISGVHTAYHRGDYTIVELVQAYLTRIDQINPQLNYVLAINPDAIEQAQALDDEFQATHKLRPLHGVPMLVKDNIITAAMPTTFGSKLAVPGKEKLSDNAPVITQLQDAGAIILGKTAMPDWATDLFSASTVTTWTENPYDRSRDTGGSSSGTAAGIACNLALVGVGSDTGGSIRLPSAFCGVVGMRPTVGLISSAGISVFVGSQDTVGPICRTVTDAARVLDTLALPTSPQFLRPRGESYAALLTPSNLPGPVHLGHLPELGADDDGVRAVFTQVLDRLRQHPLVTISDLTIPDLTTSLDAASINLSRGKHDLNDFLGPMFNTSVEAIYQANEYPSSNFAIPGMILDKSTATDCYKQSDTRDALEHAVTAHMLRTGVETLLFLTAGKPAPLREDIEDPMDGLKFPYHTMLASTLRWPAISVPAGLTSTGLPVGIEIVGRPLSEQRLLEVAFVVEQIVMGRQPPPELV
ncbi:amidase signature enzyme [Aspergillus sclerotioniger CBS 115572]|uniref:Amidase signature enzyme n=1 Tax=Aspergillus sclerotioniger CBS 115572 TaxID=1450535 RepID=A0A317UWS3_9EURO|nr:amidase signature enzyme [Aspergillus sclerotioniger CBS 115572]PWY64977.1 amidase signature enzyme [Aspergillus sclerotioniger CBS 115572]